MSCALQGGFLTTGPPVKSLHAFKEKKKFQVYGGLCESKDWICMMLTGLGSPPESCAVSAKLASRDAHSFLRRRLWSIGHFG